MGCQGSKAPTAPKQVGATLLQGQQAEGIDAVKAGADLAGSPPVQDVSKVPPVAISPKSPALARDKESSEVAALAEARFVIGQEVECRDPSSCFQGLSQWKAGTVTCTDPLKITRDGHHSFAYEWGEVRPLQQSFALGQRVECRDPGSSFEGLSSWKLGTVVSIDPLTISRDGHLPFAYEWSEVRASQEPVGLVKQEVSRATSLTQAEKEVASVVAVDVQKSAGNSSSIGRASFFSCEQFCRTAETESEIVIGATPLESS